MDVANALAGIRIPVALALPTTTPAEITAKLTELIAIDTAYGAGTATPAETAA